MQQFYRDYLERLQRLHEDAKATLEGWEIETLDWKPGPEMNSLCVLVVHTTGAERFWIGDVGMRDPSDRKRDSEFQAAGLNPVDLASRLDTNLNYIQQAFEELRIEDLEQPRITPDNRKVTLGWCLAHVLAHTANHVGHMQLTRQLLKREE
jgi:uncharacterized damage-inducible protein DinB